MAFLRTKQDIINEVTTRINATSVSPIITPSVIDQEVNNSYVFCGRVFRWPQLRDAQVTDTNGLINYDYPIGWYPESIVRVEVAGLNPPVFARKNFDDFLDYIENFPTDKQTQIFANFGNQYFLNPVQVAAPGTKNLTVYGQKVPAPLLNPTDITIFTDMDPLGNEAIVKQALAVCEAILQGKDIGQVESVEAVNLLGTIFKKIKEDSQNDQRLDHPMFRVPDYFSGNAQVSDIGGFNIVVVGEGLE